MQPPCLAEVRGNAGAVDIGGGLAVVLKMESHNHPSAVEPFQGAATGVGGILRDTLPPWAPAPSPCWTLCVLGIRPTRVPRTSWAA